MCGIAGYSLRPRSSVERTLAAQALLAAIAERGADAVGYAYRAPAEIYADGREAAHARVAAARARLGARRPRTSCSSTSATTRRAIPSIAANNHPVRHGPVVGIHNGIILNDDELLAPHSCARAEPRMTVDSEAIFAIAAHSRNDARALEHLRGAMATGWIDEREPGVVFIARGMRPAAVGRRRPRRLLLRLDEGRTRGRRALLPASGCASVRCRRGRSSRSRTASASEERFVPDLEYVEHDPLPSVRAPQEREFCLTRLAALAAAA